MGRSTKAGAPRASSAEAPGAEILNLEAPIPPLSVLADFESFFDTLPALDEQP